MELTLRCTMRGEDKKQSSMLVLMSPETMVPTDHPIRGIKRLADEVLARLSPTFDAMYASVGRPSIPPERLLKAHLLMALYTVRSERQLCEQIAYNLLFRWFLDMDMVEPSFDATVFTKNRDRLLEHDVAGEFFRVVVEHARAGRLMSSDHFTVDGTLIEACASLKSFKKKDSSNNQPHPGNPSVDFHGEKRGNETHVSTTDPEAKLARKGVGKEAKLCFSAHALMENRNGLLVDLRVAEADGRAERDTALFMLADYKDPTRTITVAGDKGYDTRDFVADCRAINVVPSMSCHQCRAINVVPSMSCHQCRAINVVPHVAQNRHERRHSAIDQRTTRHPGYVISQRIRKRVEEIFGWCKTVGGFRRTRYRGQRRTQMAAYLVGAAYNLLRISRLVVAAA
jgi:transposase